MDDYRVEKFSQKLSILILIYRLWTITVDIDYVFLYRLANALIVSAIISGDFWQLFYVSSAWGNGNVTKIRSNL